MLIYVCIDPLFFHVAHLHVHIVYIAHITRSNYWDRTVKLEHTVRWHMFHMLTCVRTVHVHDVRARKVSAYYCSLLPKTIFTHLVLGSRSVGLTSATFFSQSKISKQPQLTHFEHSPRSTMPYRVPKNCSELLDMTQTCPTKNAQNCSKWPELARKKCTKWFKIAQSCSKLFKIVKIAQNVSKMGQQVSKGVLCLHIRARSESCHYLALMLPMSIFAWA